MSDSAEHSGARLRRAAPAASTAAAVAANRAERRVHFALATLVLAYAVCYSGACVIKYHWFLYDDIDLAIFTHTVAGLLRGTLASSVSGMSGLGDHSSLNLFLLEPFYAIARTPLTLLILQTIALALGAIPVFRLARRELRDERAALACAALYLIYPALGFVNLFEFHPEAFSTPALLAALVALREGRTRSTALWAGLSLLGKEDVALVVIGMAFYALLLRRPDCRRQALWLAGLAIGSLVLSFGVLKPALGGGLIRFESMYARWGGSPLEIVLSLASHPLAALATLFSTPGDAHDTLLKQQYWLQLLLPLALIPLAAPELLLLALPILFEHLLSWRAQQHTLVYQYGALVIPFVMAATVVGLGRIAAVARAGPPEQSARRIALLALLFALASQATFGPFASVGFLRAKAPPQRILPTEYDRAMAAEKRRMLARIPERGAVVAGFDLLVPLAGCADLHSLHHIVSGKYIFSARPYPIPGGVVAMVADWSAPLLMMFPDSGTGARLSELAERNHLVPVEALGDLVLYLREPATALGLLGREPCDSGASRPVIFERQLAFSGATLLEHSLTAGGLLRFRTCWRSVAHADGLFLTEWLILDSSGSPVLSHMRHLGYMTAPLSDRPVGDWLEENYGLWLPVTLAPGRYTLAMRVGIERAGRATLASASDPAVAAREGVIPLGAFVVTAAAAGAPDQ